MRHTAPAVSELPFLPLSHLSELIARNKVSPVEIVNALLDRIDRHDGALHSYITVCREPALDAARRAERDIRAGRRRGPLHGLPISHKDISWTRGVRTTAHSRTLLDFVPEHDATHVARLARAGMIMRMASGWSNSPIMMQMPSASNAIIVSVCMGASRSVRTATRNSRQYCSKEKVHWSRHCS